MAAGHPVSGPPWSSRPVPAGSPHAVGTAFSRDAHSQLRFTGNRDGVLPDRFRKPAVLLPPAGARRSSAAGAGSSQSGAPRRTITRCTACNCAAFNLGRSETLGNLGSLLITGLTPFWPLWPSTSVHEGSVHPCYQGLLLTGAPPALAGSAGRASTADTPSPAVPRSPLTASSTDGFLAVLHVFASKGGRRRRFADAEQRTGKADGGCCGCSISVQHPQRVPLGGLPAIWCSGACSRSCQLIPAGVGRFSDLLARLDGHDAGCNAIVRPRDLEDQEMPILRPAIQAIAQPSEPNGLQLR